MQIKIKRVDKSLPLPAYKTKGAAAFDLYARVETVVPAHSIAYIPLNFILELPENTWFLMAARSSLHKSGLMAGNGICIGDRDFCGEDDEYNFIAYNFTNKSVTIEKGQRIAQGMVMNLHKPELIEVDSFAHNESRGGIGSTGKF